jgi:integrase
MKTDFLPYAEAYFDLRYQAGDIAFHTWKNSVSHLRSFGRFLRETGRSAPVPLSGASPELFQEYRIHCIRAGNRAATVDRKLLPLRLALQRAESEGKVRPGTTALSFPAGKGKGTRSETGFLSGDNTPVRFLTDRQMRKLCAYYQTLAPGWEKDCLDLFLFSFHACGLRISDIVTLEWKHIDRKKGLLSKVLVKTRARHSIPLSAPALEILYRWKGRAPGGRFVFGLLPQDFEIREDGSLEKAVDNRNRTIRATLNAVGRKLGFPFPLGMHVARHTFAVKALNASRLDVHLISRLLGHSSVTITEKVYATFLLPTLTSEIRSRLSFSEFSPVNMPEKARNDDFL